jgi:hypothetical protein
MPIAVKKSDWIPVGIIFLISTALAFGLIGRQVFYANWGIIDDHAFFGFMGPHQRLPITDVFHTLLTKTEVGDPSSGRWRPSYYFFMLLEAVAWGKNVHLWYLARTLFFATFIASVWWLLGKFVRIWLAFALLLPMLFLPFWGGVWARLGPSEIYGTLALALMLFGIYHLVKAPDEGRRKWGAALVTFAAVLLIGSKETLIPLAGASFAVLLFAGFTRRIPIWMAVSYSLVVGLYAAAVFFVILRAVSASGQDYYANTIDIRQILGLAGRASVSSAFGSGVAFCYIIAIAFFGYWAKRSRRNLREWIISSNAVVAIFLFMAGVYFSQQVFYRGQLPLLMRYDFPASLFVPFSYYALICYIFYQLRLYLDSRATNYVAIFLTFMICVVYAPRFAVRFNSRPLPQAVSANIQVTNIFFNEVSALAEFAKKSPRSPVILEAYDPGTFEALFSIHSYVRALGVENPISVRLHASGGSKGALNDGLERRIRTMENEGDSDFVALSKSLADPQGGCISVGINGPANETCAGFEVRV